MARREPRVQSIKRGRKKNLILEKDFSKSDLLETLERERGMRGKNPSAISRVLSIGSR